MMHTSKLQIISTEVKIVEEKKELLEKKKFEVKIEGESCLPHLIPEKTYLANTEKAKIGDFIVFHNPKNTKQIFVKRVKSLTSKGIEVEGTVSWASSSKDFGLVSEDLVLGKIIK